jgi:hypothetical protein
VRGRLSEAADGIAVAPEHAEAVSGFAKARGPTQGKEEATEPSPRADLWPSRDVRHYGCRRPDRPSVVPAGTRIPAPPLMRVRVCGWLRVSAAVAGAATEVPRAVAGGLQTSGRDTSVVTHKSVGWCRLYVVGRITV